MKIKQIVSLVLAATILLASCNSASTADDDQSNLPLRIAYTDWAGDYIVLLAQELGLFAEYDLNVIPVHYGSFSDAFPDLATRKVDGANLVPIDLLPIIQSNDMKIVMVTDCSDGADQIVASAEILSIADLRGKRIGVNTGTFGEFLVQEMLTRNGMTISDVSLIDIGPEMIPVSIPGLVDAGHTWEPHTSEAESLGQHILFTSAEMPGLLPDVFAFRAEVVAERPEDIRHFVAAWLEAAQFWVENPAEGSRIIAGVLGVDPAEVSLEGIKVYTAEDNRLAFADYPGIDASSIYYVIAQNLAFSIKSGYITIAPDIKLIVDPSFLP